MLGAIHDATTEDMDSVCGQVPTATIEELGIHAMFMVIYMILHRQSWRQTHRQEKVGGENVFLNHQLQCRHTLKCCEKM